MVWKSRLIFFLGVCWCFTYDFVHVLKMVFLVGVRSTPNPNQQVNRSLLLMEREKNSNCSSFLDFFFILSKKNLSFMKWVNRMTYKGRKIKDFRYRDSKPISILTKITKRLPNFLLFYFIFSSIVHYLSCLLY